MAHWLSRTELLIGADALHKLQQSKVAVIGLGGVGGAAAEALLRSGIGSLLLVDHDAVSETNLNRQLFATRQTIGIPKCEAARQRLSAISPECQIITEDSFYSADNRAALFAFSPDYVIDAIDTVSAKLDLAVQCSQHNIPLLMCLGTGNRRDPSRFRIGDIAETVGCGCGLARVMRRELKKRGVLRQTVLFSEELPQTTVCPDSENGRHAPASISFCPPVAGYLLAGYAVNCLIQANNLSNTEKT